MQILNIAGYKFITLSELPELRSRLLAECSVLKLKGTILISHEGININLAGMPGAIQLFKNFMKQDLRFADLTFKDSTSFSVPFDRLKVKIKKEIITMRRQEVQPKANRAPSISPEQLKQWLEEKKDFILLDTRNNYEIDFGTFANATNLQIEDFCDFPNAAKILPQKKPIVMFCTGGIRCEKAALHLLNEGFSDVYQLEGGILNYFNKVGGAHFEGACFVFDQRVALDANLQAIET